MNEQLGNLERRFRRLAHISPLRVLMAMCVCTLLVSIGLLGYLHRSSEHVVADIALKTARGAAAMALRRNESDAAIEASWTAHKLKVQRLPNALNTPNVAGDTSFEGRAIIALRREPTQPYHQMMDTPSGLESKYAIADGQGGIVVIENGQTREFHTLTRNLTRLFAAIGAGIMLVILGFGILLLGMERVLQDAALVPVSQRRLLMADIFADNARSGRRSQLIPITVLCALFFAIGMRFPSGSFGVIYLTAVLLSLASSRVWHTHYAAVLSTMLIFTKLMLAQGTGLPWILLINSVLSVLAIWTTVLLSLTNSTRERSETLVRAQAEAKERESEALRAALARAEAAEAELRPALERLNLATQAAGIGVWDRDLINGAVTGDETFWQLLDSPEPEPTVDIYHRNVPEE
ncbi:MAG: hypothetical protein H7Y02_06830, partial [Candidatus Obscuribacterales bacterium]|nr:hypothetical protein [Steroidobacteraceae bacterium]